MWVESTRQCGPGAMLQLRSCGELEKALFSGTRPGSLVSELGQLPCVERAPGVEGSPSHSRVKASGYRVLQIKADTFS